MATSPNGVLFELGCGSAPSCGFYDPDGDPLHGFTWTGEGGFSITEANGPPTARVRLAIGRHPFELSVEDGRGGVGRATVIVNVLGQNTFAGGGSVTPVNDYRFDVIIQGFDHPATITFDNVTGPGLTWVTTRVDQNPPAPIGVQAGTPPVYVDVHTSATFSGTAQVCLNTQGMSLADPARAQVHEWQSGNWSPLATDRPAAQLCAAATFPSGSAGDRMTTLAIFYPPVPETAITTIAGTGFYPGQIDGNPSGGADSRDNFVDDGPATQSAIGSIFHGALDRPRSYVYLTSDSLLRLDLNTGKLRRAAGGPVSSLHP